VTKIRNRKYRDFCFQSLCKRYSNGVVVALMIQPWTSQWMDMVSIYLCPLGAFTAGLMYFWVMKKETALAAVEEGYGKPIMGWFHSVGKYAYVPLCLTCFILGILYGSIG